MVKRAGLLTLSFLLLPALNSAQKSNCPQGFAYVGTLSGTGSIVEGLNKKMVLKLPDIATLDDSFQQTKIRSTSAKGKANLRPQDIPKGILIIPHGSEDTDKTWSVSEPQLTASKGEDENGILSTRYEFGMRLSCSAHGSPYNQQGGDCDVAVEVCYKPKSDK